MLESAATRQRQLDQFAASLIGLPISHIWRGYGSAVFFEFGKLRPRHRRDGSPGNAKGEWTLMIEWNWRIEGKRRIWCGSDSEESRWTRVSGRLPGACVQCVHLVGRIPEIDLALSNGLHIVSMMTAEGDPEWALLNGERRSVSVAAGRLKFEGWRALPERP